MDYKGVIGQFRERNNCLLDYGDGFMGVLHLSEWIKLYTLRAVYYSTSILPQ